MLDIDIISDPQDAINAEDIHIFMEEDVALLFGKTVNVLQEALEL